MNETLCRRVVAERSGGVCEIRNLIVCQGRATNMSHRKARGQGGQWTPSNILHACGSGTTGCHGWAEREREEARAYGFLIFRSDDPAQAPVLHAAHGWVLLDDLGGWQRVEVPHVA
jgi:hypothetical protein